MSHYDNLASLHERSEYPLGEVPHATYFDLLVYLVKAGGKVHYKQITERFSPLSKDTLKQICNVPPMSKLVTYHEGTSYLHALDSKKLTSAIQRDASGFSDFSIVTVPSVIPLPEPRVPIGLGDLLESTGKQLADIFQDYFRQYQHDGIRTWLDIMYPVEHNYFAMRSSTWGCILYFCDLKTSFTLEQINEAILIRRKLSNFFRWSYEQFLVIITDQIETDVKNFVPSQHNIFTLSSDLLFRIVGIIESVGQSEHNPQIIRFMKTRLLFSLSYLFGSKSTSIGDSVHRAIDFKTILKTL
ncbi:MAG: hypothetical protein H6673_15645 [Anaerolineales bacterium]|nr:hypothetical protein [Anaerolineales bacterium]